MKSAAADLWLTPMSHTWVPRLTGKCVTVVQHQHTGFWNQVSRPERQNQRLSILVPQGWWHLCSEDHPWVLLSRWLDRWVLLVWHGAISLSGANRTITWSVSSTLKNGNTWSPNLTFSFFSYFLSVMKNGHTWKKNLWNETQESMCNEIVLYFFVLFRFCDNWRFISLE